MHKWETNVTPKSNMMNSSIKSPIFPHNSAKSEFQSYRKNSLGKNFEYNISDYYLTSNNRIQTDNIKKRNLPQISKTKLDMNIIQPKENYQYKTRQKKETYNCFNTFFNVIHVNIRASDNLQTLSSRIKPKKNIPFNNYLLKQYLQHDQLNSFRLNNRKYTGTIENQIAKGETAKQNDYLNKNGTACNYEVIKNGKYRIKAHSKKIIINELLKQIKEN